MPSYLLQLEPRAFRLMLIAGVVLLSVALLLYGVKPKYLGYRQTTSSLQLLQDRVDDQQQLDAEISTVRSRYESLQKKLHGDAQNLPLNQMESYLIGRLQSVSWNSQVELVSVKPSHATRVLGFEEVGFEVGIRGEYQALYNWLSNLSGELGFILVKNYEIAPDGNAAKLGMKLTMVFYRPASET